MIAIEAIKVQDCVIGHYRHRQLVILIDRGSTNYFLNEKVIEDLKVPLV